MYLSNCLVVIQRILECTQLSWNQLIGIIYILILYSIVFIINDFCVENVLKVIDILCIFLRVPTPYRFLKKTPDLTIYMGNCVTIRTLRGPCSYYRIKLVTSSEELLPKKSVKTPFLIWNLFRLQRLQTSQTLHNLRFQLIIFFKTKKTVLNFTYKYNYKIRYRSSPLW